MGGFPVSQPQGLQNDLAQKRRAERRKEIVKKNNCKQVCSQIKLPRDGLWAEGGYAWLKLQKGSSDGIWLVTLYIPTSCIQ